MGRWVFFGVFILFIYFLKSVACHFVFKRSDGESEEMTQRFLPKKVALDFVSCADSNNSALTDKDMGDENYDNNTKN